MKITQASLMDIHLQRKWNNLTQQLVQQWDLCLYWGVGRKFKASLEAVAVSGRFNHSFMNKYTANENEHQRFSIKSKNHAIQIGKIIIWEINQFFGCLLKMSIDN